MKLVSDWVIQVKNEGTRHNIGFIALDEWAYNIMDFQQTGFKGMLSFC